MREYFRVPAKKYDATKLFDVVRPSSLGSPKDNSVMFITEEHFGKWRAILSVRECIVIWPEGWEIPEEALRRHVILKHPEPRLGFAMFFHENGITYNVQPCEYELVGGAYICKGAKIGKGTVIFPGAYIDAGVSIGDNCYIASGVRLMGTVKVGNNVIIRENTVVGSDGLTTRRDESGKVITIPQFGGVAIEDNVQIGALTVIAKGAIDDTVIRSGSRIDNSCFLSHNVRVGEDTLVVGEAIMFGSSSTGERAYISGNATVREGVSVGSDAVVGMGAVVVRPVAEGATVKGNPAR